MSSALLRQRTYRGNGGHIVDAPSDTFQSPSVLDCGIRCQFYTHCSRFSYQHNQQLCGVDTGVTTASVAQPSVDVHSYLSNNKRKKRAAEDPRPEDDVSDVEEGEPEATVGVKRKKRAVGASAVQPVVSINEKQGSILFVQQ